MRHHGNQQSRQIKRRIESGVPLRQGPGDYAEDRGSAAMHHGSTKTAPKPNTETRLRKSLQVVQILGHTKTRADRKAYDGSIHHETDAVPEEQIDQYARLQGFFDAWRDVAPVRWELEMCQTHRRSADHPGRRGQQ